MMYCSDCGAQIPYGENGCPGCPGSRSDGDTYCSECGGSSSNCTCDDGPNYVSSN